MKESKISLLLLVSLSLLLLAFVVLFIWGFTYYKQSIQAAQPNTIVIKDSSAIAGNIRDSLQKIYTSTINKLNTELDSTRNNVDSFQYNMNAKLFEFNELKNEIGEIMKKKSTGSGDIGLARQKIQELQLRLEEWRGKYNDVTEENKRLSYLLQQLSKNINITDKVSGKSDADNKISNLPVPTGFIVTEIALQAIMQLDDKEQVTYLALQTDAMKGSVELKNNSLSLPGTEIYIIVLQPDGKVMKHSAWETGMFQTSEGRKVYSYKMRFDYLKGESKRLNFSIAAAQYQKGNYILQLYHNGKIIATTSKSLS